MGLGHNTVWLLFNFLAEILEIDNVVVVVVVVVCCSRKEPYTAHGGSVEILRGMGS